tara:strand:+ start:49 stop:1068 length:1020 start_codon:yes stop_codon:yes gene_type:complete
MYLGSVAFSEAAFGDEGSLSATIAITGVQANAFVGSISVAGNTGVELPTQVATFSIEPPTINSDANITVTASLVATTQLGTLTSIVGDANVTPDSVLLTGSLGLLTFTGDANLDLPSLVATAVVDTTGLVIFADANVDLPTFVATGSLGLLTFTGDANVELPLSNAVYGSANFNDNVIYGGGGGLVATTQLGLLTINSDANVDAPTFVATTQLGTLAGITGDANVEPQSVILNGSIGLLTFEGDANLTITDSLVATTQIVPTLSVVGTATIDLPTIVAQTSIGIALITTISQNDYNKERTLIIPVRQHKVRSQNEVGQQLRTVIVPPRRRITVTTNIAA